MTLSVSEPITIDAIYRLGQRLRFEDKVSTTLSDKGLNRYNWLFG
jgi:hypothetical protein